MGANEKQVAGGHYKKLKIQHWDYVVANEIPYLEAQVIKYVTRHRDKHGVQDLEKAAHFLEKLIEVEKLRKEPCICVYNPKTTSLVVDPNCKAHAP